MFHLWKVRIFFLLLMGMPALSVQASITVLGSLTRAFHLDVGQVVEGRIQVHNLAAEPMLARAYLNDVQETGAGHTQFREPGVQVRSNANWVRLLPAEQIVPPLETAEIHFRIQAPGDPGLVGSYWSMLMVEGSPLATLAPSTPQAEPPGVHISTVFRTGVRLATHMLQSGEGRIDFTGKNLMLMDGVTVLQLEMANTGDRALKLMVWAELFSEQGRSLGRFSGTAQGLYPGDVQYARIAFTGVPPGIYEALVVADHDAEDVFGALYRLEIR